MIRNIRIQRFISRLLCFLLLAVNLQGVASAGIVNTDELYAQEQMAGQQSDIRALIERQDVREALVAKGVSPDEVMGRVNSLNQTELAMLHDRLEQLPAGEGALEVVLLIFLILVITDLTGLTDVFPRI